MSDGDDCKRDVLTVEEAGRGTWRLRLRCGHTRIVGGKKRPGFERITCITCLRAEETRHE